ncbi:MAG TPA: GNAT family N-acetyltransferase [Isosphaeraceae bacterium]|nr:GNAT family N-acetyltransferase [Isosphaeraceae bacterium]
MRIGRSFAAPCGIGLSGPDLGKSPSGLSSGPYSESDDAAVRRSAQGDCPRGFVLRQYRPEDAPALVLAVTENLEHLRPWMPWIALEPTTLEEREELIARWDREWEEGAQYSFGMFIGARVVGGAGLMRRIAPDGLEIGYWVHRDYTGRGFATHAAGALTTVGLSLPNVNHVEIHHDKANVASGRVPLKLGFEKVREEPDEISAPGETGVSCVWSIDRAVWASRAM